MSVNTQVTLASTPSASPQENNFAVVEAPMPVPGANEVLCKTLYLSLDPYMRSQIASRHISGSIAPGDVLKGETVSEVVHSNVSEFAAGDIVRCFGGWQAYSVHDPQSLTAVDKRIKPASYALSILGMPGLTAFAGLIWQANVKAGDTVVVPAATGAVGATVGQLAKLRGATVIGIAGSDEKCRYARETLGYEHCLNRKSEDIGTRLNELCPKGVDVFFDLVGGPLLYTVSERLAVGARVILCGLMAEYNQKERIDGPPPGFWIRARATVYGLVVYDFEGRRQAFVDECLPLVESGKLIMLEDVEDGLTQAPAAFCRLMRGENMGKAIVKVAEPSY